MGRAFGSGCLTEDILEKYASAFAPAVCVIGRRTFRKNMKPPISDSEALNLLRREELGLSLPESRFGLKDMRRSLLFSVLYAVAVMAIGYSMPSVSVIFGFVSILTVGFTLIDEYEQFSRRRIAALLELMASMKEYEKPFKQTD